MKFMENIIAMKIVVINGRAQSGKDTFVEFAQNWAQEQGIKHPERNIFVYNISSVGFIKDIAKKAGWDGIKDERGRKLLSDLKDCLTEYDDIPFKKMIKLINFHLLGMKGFKKPTNNIVFFLHVREPKEIKRLVNEYHAVSLFIRRPGQELIESNHADKNVEDYKYDIYFNNDGNLNDLKLAVENFMEKLIIEPWRSYGEGIESWDEEDPWVKLP